MKKLLTLLLLPLLLGLSGCGQAAKLSDAEIAAIVDAALTRGEIANAFYAGDFSYAKYTDYIMNAAGQALGEIASLSPEWYDAFGYDGEKTAEPAAALFAAPLTEAGFRGVFTSAFVPELAERYLQELTDKFTFTADKAYCNKNVPTVPPSLIVWQHEPLRVLSQSAGKIEVELSGTYMLTGTETALPLTLTNVDGQWLLDESFSPREYTEADYYYTGDEVDAILADVMARADIANKVNFYTGFNIIPSSIQDKNGKPHGEYISYGGGPLTALIDTETQYDEPYARLAKELRTTDDVKRCFTDAFVPDFAEECIDILFDYYVKDQANANPGYVDRPDGLAVSYDVEAVMLNYSPWQADRYLIWQNSADQIVLIMVTLETGDGFFYDQYCPLRITKMNDKWYCDETYRAIGHYGGTNWNICL